MKDVRNLGKMLILMQIILSIKVMGSLIHLCRSSSIFLNDRLSFIFEL